MTTDTRAGRSTGQTQGETPLSLREDVPMRRHVHTIPIRSDNWEIRAELRQIRAILCGQTQLLMETASMLESLLRAQDPEHTDTYSQTT